MPIPGAAAQKCAACRQLTTWDSTGVRAPPQEDDSMQIMRSAACTWCACSTGICLGCQCFCTLVISSRVTVGGPFLAAATAPAAAAPPTRLPCTGRADCKTKGMLHVLTAAQHALTSSASASSLLAALLLHSARPLVPLTPCHCSPCRCCRCGSHQPAQPALSPLEPLLPCPVSSSSSQKGSPAGRNG